MSKSYKQRLVLPFALVAFAFSACDCAAPPGVGDSGPQTVGEVGPDAGSISCDTDADCPFGEICQAERCRSSDPSARDTGCWTDDDCGEGERCALSTGQCIDEADFPDRPAQSDGPCDDGDQRFCGSKVGLCSYGTETCTGGEWSGVCEEATDAVAELCDGADNDCDGDADEDFTALSTTCSDGVGACAREGSFVCADDGLDTECSATAAVAETPDELCGGDPDEDCDGEEEEGFETRGQDCTVGQGKCEATGFLRCTVDRAGLECSATPGTAEPAELCGFDPDDNCDGQEEEGFENVGSGCTINSPGCATPIPGILECTADGSGTECVPTVQAGEVCNGADDDGDMCIDEGFPVGNSCAVGTGACRRTGARICNNAGDGTVCDATPGPANPEELCNGVEDDDCDGVSEADEFPTKGNQCSVGVGECEADGQLVCNGAGTGVTCDAVAGTPGVELCGDGRDSDCNGLGENPGDDAMEFPALNQPCFAGIGACRRAGFWQCDTDTGQVVCNAQPASPTAEICDGIDNNCNTVVDDGCDDDGDGYCDDDPTLGWTAGAAATCPNTTSLSTRDCNDQPPVGGAVNPGVAENCATPYDDNCNNQVNEGCGACDPAVDADFDGSNECDDCDDRNGAVFPGATERCDGVDNNCAGGIDEGFDGDGDGFTTCGTIPSGGLSPARVDCDDSNDTIFPGACELCALNGTPVACNAPNNEGDGVDQNCDGYVDETCEPCDANDNDGDGYSDCEGDCNDVAGDNGANVFPGNPEVCDGYDNDCNATTVDNCGVSDTCNHDGDSNYDNDPDVCGERLFCVESLGNGGQSTGNFSCTSLCNYSGPGVGIGDGCQADEICALSLTPTANQHGCAKATDFGTEPAGTQVSDASECRSGRVWRDGNGNNAPRYCTDYCGSDAYCPSGTVCQADGVFPNTIWLGECRPPSSGQDRGVGESCNDTSLACRAGQFACLDVGGGSEICSSICCANDDCPNGYYCSLEGPRFLGPNGGVDVIPMCWPEEAGNAGRPAGAACSANDECASEFCDATLSICVDLCCNDTTCPGGTTCEDALANLPTVTNDQNGQSFVRACVNLTPADPLEPMP